MKPEHCDWIGGPPESLPGINPVSGEGRNRTPAIRKPPIKSKTVERERVLERDPVEVYCRIRPPDSIQEGICVESVDSRTVKLVPPESSIAFRNGVAKEQSYRFQNVYGMQSTQKEVFDNIAKPLVVDVLNGKNGLLFAYGVTGSGKTYTMLGSSQDGGIVPRTLDVVFNSIQDCQTKKFVFKPDKMNGFEIQNEEDAKMDRIRSEALARVTRAKSKRDGSSSQDNSQRIPDQSKINGIDDDNMFAIFVSYIEIYNNYIYDLLDDSFEASITKIRQTKILREDENHNMYVHGCNEIEVKTPEEAMEVMQKGQRRRKVAHTKLNMESSRSHSIFTIRVAQAPLDAEGEKIVTDKYAVMVSQLSLVDLAGSERTSRTKASGDRLKEAGNINNSLMMLRNCIEVLRENQLTGTNKMVPYRDSRITHYFKNFFDGEGKVRMIVCVNPRADDYDETFPVMKFAELAAEVQVQRCMATPSSHRLIGLTPGRKKANQLFKEVRRRLEEQGEDVKKLDMDLTPIYTLAPSWPPVNFTAETWEEVAQKLKSYLLKRIQSREKLASVVGEKAMKVRQKIVDMDKEIILLRQDKLSLQGLYDDAMKKIHVLENMVITAEAANDSMHRKFSDYNELVDNYKQALEERDMAMSQGQLDKQRMKAKLKAKLEMERDRLVKEMNRNLTEQKNNLKNQMYYSQVKALKEIFGTNTVNGNSRTPRHVATPFTAYENNHGMASKESSVVRPSTSDPKLNEVKNTPTLRGPAVSNPRHRRSLSQGDIWLDHRPNQVIDPNTVLQPSLKKRRSVTRVQSGDLVGDKVTNYCLTTQEQDSAGELETKLYKGDVLPTVGGGAQVVFQDVEVLKQRDPCEVSVGVKRDSDGRPITDLNTIQDRCGIAIHGHRGRATRSSKEN